MYLKICGRPSKFADQNLRLPGSGTSHRACVVSAFRGCLEVWPTHAPWGRNGHGENARWCVLVRAHFVCGHVCRNHQLSCTTALQITRTRTRTHLCAPHRSTRYRLILQARPGTWPYLTVPGPLSRGRRSPPEQIGRAETGERPEYRTALRATHARTHARTHILDQIDLQSSSLC